MDESTCNLCGAVGGRVVHVADPGELLGVALPPYPIVRCGGCGLVYAVGRKDPAFLRGLYDEGYYDGRYRGGYRGYAADREESVRRNAGRVATLGRLRPPPGRVLDVGRALGFFLEAAVAVSFAWGHHPDLGPPFLGAGCVIDCGARRVRAVGLDGRVERGARA